MASVIGTFVPTYQGLSATDFVRAAATETDCFPFNVPHRLPFYRARNAIYHLFRTLRETRRSLTVRAECPAVRVVVRKNEVQGRHLRPIALAG